MKKPILPDVLEENLDVVFCGMAAGPKSAETRTYYADSGNRFWTALHELGLTPYQIQPCNFPPLFEYGLGLTDLFKFRSGTNKRLPTRRNVVLPLAFDLKYRIESYKPRILVFNGKGLAQMVLKHLFDAKKGEVDYGLQGRGIGETKIWVLTSTSGQNGHWNKYWRQGQWRTLAKYVKQSSS